MTSHKLVRLATLAVLAAGFLANPVDFVEKVVRRRAGPPTPAWSTITAPDGEVIASSTGHLFVGTTETLTLSTITENEFTVHGIVFTFEGDVPGAGVPYPTVAPKDLPNSEGPNPPAIPSLAI